jgi:hypothetical protein
VCRGVPPKPETAVSTPPKPECAPPPRNIFSSAPLRRRRVGRADRGALNSPSARFFFGSEAAAVRRQSVRKALLRTMFTVSRSVFA